MGASSAGPGVSPEQVWRRGGRRRVPKGPEDPLHSTWTSHCRKHLESYLVLVNNGLFATTPGFDVPRPGSRPGPASPDPPTAAANPRPSHRRAHPRRSRRKREREGGGPQAEGLPSRRPFPTPLPRPPFLPQPAQRMEREATLNPPDPPGPSPFPSPLPHPFPPSGTLHIEGSSRAAAVSAAEERLSEFVCSTDGNAAPRRTAGLGAKFSRPTNASFTMDTRTRRSGSGGEGGLPRRVRVTDKGKETLGGRQTPQVLTRSRFH